MGGDTPATQINFPLEPIDFDFFLKLNAENCEVSTHLVNSGFIDKTGKTVVPPWFIGRSPRNRKKTETRGNRPRDIVLEDLQVGDFLAHRDHGVGIYRGLKQETIDDKINEYLILEYADNSLIYVSTEKFRRISFYASGNEIGVIPDSLHKKTKWKRKKAAAQRQAEAAVAFLVDLYAKESSLKRPPYPVEAETEQILLNQFDYEDTPDQQTSWNEISADLSQSKPMNRLLCGDVGFGKTEIAIRAAFRVAYSGKMVVVLAPTTILANQLYAAFDARLKGFSINVDIISRFRSKNEVNEIKLKIKQGVIDVIVGTHALLSDNIVYNNIGLLIVDEEHRFGVSQKEKLKTLQKSIDVLYMSATPIPRTLHMALNGIRNISTLFTPPKTRLPINTQISYYDIELIERAINFEIKRGGQVFFVHNNTKSLPEIADKIQALLPGVSVDFVHGQLPAQKLENTMVHFIRGDIQVLVTTSIIETGIDIQNANTIIINRAHLFGLSQLYQMRGRVGRGNRLAYAYLLIPKRFQLSPDAYKRLKAIEENTSLGSGYNISKNDLEIRGAGTLFGFKQSGGAGGVGFELYSQFINEAIRKQTSNHEDSHIGKINNVSVRLFADTVIPLDYIRTTNLRLSFYKRLSLANYISEVNQIEYEILNRFGPAPQSVSHLIASTRIRILGARTFLEKAVFKQQTILLDFQPFPINSKLDRFFETAQDYFSYTKRKHWFKKKGEHALSLVITPASLEDITSLVLGFLNKLQNVF
ncbi:MAG: DEAD/DEAH box helicase [FCB group bacterium]|nr:DEAD/DEAH box helicase [FCB group bacterium]